VLVALALLVPVYKRKLGKLIPGRNGGTAHVTKEAS